MNHPRRHGGIPRVGRVAGQHLAAVHIHVDVLAVHRAAHHLLELALLLLRKRGREVGRRRRRRKVGRAFALRFGERKGLQGGASESVRVFQRELLAGQERRQGRVSLSGK